MSSRALAATAVVLLAACADLERGPRPPEVDAAGGDATGGDATGAAVAFAAVRPLLVAGCASCHATGQQAGNTTFLLGMDAAADYRSTRAMVDPMNAAGSRLLGKGTGQGHGGGAVWQVGSPEHSTVLAWIQGGAQP